MTKKILALIMVIAISLSFVACGAKNNAAEDVTGDVQNEQLINSDAEAESEAAEEELEAEKKEDKKTETVNKTEKPAEKPVEKPVETPNKAPAETPAEPPVQSTKTVGETLLADFTAKAGAESNMLSLAEKIITNPIIAFSGAAMQVEEGLLSGFGNTEIKGFKDGAMFGPVIGSVPFIGYVFNLNDGTNVDEFISTLKANADLRWNICVEADEMVVGKSGNKVFFVMCPKTFEQE